VSSNEFATTTAMTINSVVSENLELSSMRIS